MNDVLLLTTSVAEGMPVEKYYGLIAANQVAGTGFFKDLTASLSDFFGGNSGAYRESMNELREDVTKSLKEKAAELGANAVIGVRLDFDNISAKDMSMFMVSIQGTAVRLSVSKEELHDLDDLDVSWEMLYNAYQVRRLTNMIAEGEHLKDDDWRWVGEVASADIAEPLYQYYMSCCKRFKEAGGPNYAPTWTTKGKMNYKAYLASLDYDLAIEYAYRDVHGLFDIVERCNLFNAKKIMALLNGEDELDMVVSLIGTHKKSYSEEDASDMGDLLQCLRNLPEVWRKEETQGGIFSRGGLKYVCSCGCKNDVGSEFCQKCGKNIYGLTIEQQNRIEEFADLVNVLSDMMKRS